MPARDGDADARCVDVTLPNGGLLLYDVEEPAAWIESDYCVSLDGSTT